MRAINDVQSFGICVDAQFGSALQGTECGEVEVDALVKMSEDVGNAEV